MEDGTGIQFQEAFNVLQLRLCSFDRRVDVFQGLLEPCDVAVNLCGYALYSTHFFFWP